MLYGSVLRRRPWPLTAQVLALREAWVRKIRARRAWTLAFKEGFRIAWGDRPLFWCELTRQRCSERGTAADAGNGIDDASMRKL